MFNVLKQNKNLTLNGKILVDLEKILETKPLPDPKKQLLLPCPGRLANPCNNLTEEAAFQGILILLKVTPYTPIISRFVTIITPQ